MPDKPSRRQRRRVSERTGTRPERRRPAAQPEVAGPSPATPTLPAPVERPRTAAPRPTPSTAIPSAARPMNLAPSAARTAAYLQERQREIIRELRGLGVTWSIVLAIFVGIVTLLSIL